MQVNVGNQRPRPVLCCLATACWNETPAESNGMGIGGIRIRWVQNLGINVNVETEMGKLGVRHWGWSWPE